MSGSTEIPGEVCQNRIFIKAGSMHGATVVKIGTLRRVHKRDI